MEMKTLDDYLDDIDRWKEAASEATRGMTWPEQQEHYRQARAWLEAALGRPLPEAPWLQKSQPASPPRTQAS